MQEIIEELEPEEARFNYEHSERVLSETDRVNDDHNKKVAAAAVFLGPITWKMMECSFEPNLLGLLQLTALAFAGAGWFELFAFMSLASLRGRASMASLASLRQQGAELPIQIAGLAAAQARAGQHNFSVMAGRQRHVDQVVRCTRVAFFAAFVALAMKSLHIFN